MKTMWLKLNKLAQSPILPWIVGILILIPAILPCLQTSLFRVHDYTHVARLAELDRTISDGFSPPRWSKNFGFGYGMPLFSFYAPLPYYLGESVHSLGIGYEQSIQIVFALVFYFSFLAMYYLAKNYWGSLSSYFAATLFIYIPYRAVDTYVRGALGELYGILFIVVALNCLTQLATNRKLKWVIFTAVSVAGLLLSHNLMALVGVPLITIYGISMILSNKRAFWKTVILMAGGLIWGLGIAAYFVFPAIAEKSATSVDQLTQGGGDYSQHFVYLKQLINSPFGYGGSISGPYDGISFEIGKLHLLLLITAGLVLIWKWKTIALKQRFGLLFSLVMISLSIYLMSFHSSWIWQLVSPLKYLQFPWRLLAIPMIFSPFAGAFILDRLINRWKQVGSFLVVGASTTAVVVYGGLFKPEYYSSNTQPIYSTEPTYIQQQMSTVIPDYIHPQLASLVLSSEKNITPPLSRFSVTGEDAPQLTIVSDAVQSFTLRIEGDGEATVSANIFDFPGWQWFVDGKPVEHTVEASLPIMSSTVTIPASGSVEVSGILTQTPIRKFADWVSVISLVLIGLVSAIVIVRRKK